mmetsp:Transcript_71292/g.204566  ORF Transcript_71292/g.204566 Transcript_71292/m.204566 type:complete len:277 (-) Transcript_71292:406-1236(-)
MVRLCSPDLRLRCHRGLCHSLLHVCPRRAAADLSRDPCGARGRHGRRDWPSFVRRGARGRHCRLAYRAPVLPALDRQVRDESVGRAAQRQRHHGLPLRLPPLLAALLPAPRRGAADVAGGPGARPVGRLAAHRWRLLLGQGLRELGPRRGVGQRRRWRRAQGDASRVALFHRVHRHAPDSADELDRHRRLGVAGVGRRQPALRHEPLGVAAAGDRRVLALVPASHGIALQCSHLREVPRPVEPPEDPRLRAGRAAAHTRRRGLCRADVLRPEPRGV